MNKRRKRVVTKNGFGNKTDREGNTKLFYPGVVLHSKQRNAGSHAVMIYTFILRSQQGTLVFPHIWAMKKIIHVEIKNKNEKNKWIAKINGNLFSDFWFSIFFVWELFIYLLVCLFVIYFCCIIWSFYFIRFINIYIYIYI